MSDDKLIEVYVNPFYYIWSAEGHEYPYHQVGDEVNPRPVFIFS